MPDREIRHGRPPHHREYELLVASQIVETLAGLGMHLMTTRELVDDPDLRSRDLALFGLSSLDWIGLAARLEAQTGLELPDHVLLESEHRCVDGWAEAIWAGREPHT